jgi:hypothetical protein
MEKTVKRSISLIAAEIRRDWKKPNYAAIPYLEAMQDIEEITDKFGADDARGIVLYFLSNATGWRGPVAKSIKAELRAIVQGTKS